MTKKWKDIMNKVYLFDWGDTIMRNFPDEKGAMHTWQKVEAMPNAGKMLKRLSKTSDCYLATNAKDSVREDIIRALQRVNLHVYFKDIFCYRGIGYTKPSKEYFDSIIKKLDIPKSDIIMIGDDPETDIKGAEQCGINSILYDCDDKYKDFQGSRITDLLMILE